MKETKMKRFVSEFCFIDKHSKWKFCYLYGIDAEDAMERFRKDAVDLGIKGGIYFRYYPVVG